jgi:hypothetical protein
VLDRRAERPAVVGERVVKLVDAAELAEVLGVSRDYVYQHKHELGAISLGNGPRARLRFNTETALESLSACSASRWPQPPDSPLARRSRPLAERTMGTNVELLPIRAAGRAADRAQPSG